MFTQCPECNTAFRVTADVLKRAAGQVRCGGCGVAFNALAYLSEDMPKSAPRAQPKEPVPELTPDEDDDRDFSLPKRISAAQSAALLKTLDELAGSDIEIEDTGVEWRVLDSDSDNDDSSGDDDEMSGSHLIADTGAIKFILRDDDDELATDEELAKIFDAPGATSVDTNLESDSGASVVDELLSDTPTPVDQFLTATPSRVEAAEIFSDESRESPPDVMRFDDNTPLPEDFDLDSAADFAPAPPMPAIDRRAPAPDPDDPQVDLALGDPDDWEMLLGEVADPAPDNLAATENEDIEEPEAAEHEQDDVDSEDDDDTPPDMDTQFAIQAEAMGIDLSGMHKSVNTGEDAEPTAVAALDDEEQDEADVYVESIVLEGGDLEDDLEDDLDDGQEPDLDLTDTGVMKELFDDEIVLDGELDESEDDLDDDSDDLELEFGDEDSDEDIDDALELGDDSDDIELDLSDDEDELDLDVASDDSDTDEDHAETSIDEDLLAAAFENEAAQQALADADAADETEEDPDSSGEHYVPPQTEEEKTINMMIDQDFMRLAAEGEDIFSSTMVGEHSGFERRPNVETIVMEGDFVRASLDREETTAGTRRFDDTKFSSKASSDQTTTVRGGRREADPPSYGAIAGVVVLAIVLLAQVLHQSREALATVPAFTQFAGPVYRMLGHPLTPAWDISGWRFEASTSKYNEEVNVLTIYTRIGNKSTGGLPYPLVHVSLTDRFEEIIGSKVLEPGQYLTGNPDPRKPVQPGKNFDAYILIESPAEEATGFKLNACYRLANGSLRCATEDFK